MLKLWKCFRIWKKAVNHAKFAYAKASLEKNLFMLSPVFQVCVCGGGGSRCGGQGGEPGPGVPGGGARQGAPDRRRQGY